MENCVIESHQWLHKLVAEEHGFFAAEGLDYRFQAQRPAQNSEPTSAELQQSSQPAPDLLELAGAAARYAGVVLT